MQKIEELENKIAQISKELFELKLNKIKSIPFKIGDFVRVNNHSGVWKIVGLTISDFEIESMLLTKGIIRTTRFVINGVHHAWKPAEGEHYFVPILLHSLYQECPFYESYKANQWRFEHGLIFQTKEEAIAKAKEMLGIEGEV